MENNVIGELFFMKNLDEAIAEVAAAAAEIEREHEVENFENAHE